MFLLFLFGLIFFTTLITHYFFSFDGISITETPLRDDKAVCSSMCRPLEWVNTARCCVPKVKSEPDSHTHASLLRIMSISSWVNGYLVNRPK